MSSESTVGLTDDESYPSEHSGFNLSTRSVMKGEEDLEAQQKQEECTVHPGRRHKRMESEDDESKSRRFDENSRLASVICVGFALTLIVVTAVVLGAARSSKHAPTRSIQEIEQAATFLPVDARVTPTNVIQPTSEEEENDALIPPSTSHLADLANCMSAMPRVEWMGPLSLDEPIILRGTNLHSFCEVVETGDLSTARPSPIQPSVLIAPLGYDRSHLTAEEHGWNALSRHSIAVEINGRPCEVEERKSVTKDLRSGMKNPSRSSSTPLEQVEDEIRCRLQGPLGIAALPEKGEVQVSLKLARAAKVKDWAETIMPAQARASMAASSTDTSPTLPATGAGRFLDDPALELLLRKSKATKKVSRPLDVSVNHIPSLVTDEVDLTTSAMFHIERALTWFERQGIVLQVHFPEPVYGYIPLLRPLYKLFPLIVFTGPSLSRSEEQPGGVKGVQPDRQGVEFVPCDDPEETVECSRRVMESKFPLLHRVGVEKGQPLQGGLLMQHYDMLVNYHHIIHQTKANANAFWHAPIMHAGTGDGESMDELEQWISGSHGQTARTASDMFFALKRVVAQFSWAKQAESTWAPIADTLQRAAKQYEARWSHSVVDRAEADGEESQLDVVYSFSEVAYVPAWAFNDFGVLAKLCTQERVMKEVAWPLIQSSLSSTLDPPHSFNLLSGGVNHDRNLSLPQYETSIRETQDFFSHISWNAPETIQLTKRVVQHVLETDRSYTSMKDRTQQGVVQGEAQSAEVVSEN